MADDTQLFINNWSTTISDATIAVDATTINIPSADSAILGAIAANEYFAATLSDGSNLEVIWITANDESGALTVIRAKEGTSGLSYTSGDTIEIRNTKGTYENFVQRDAADTLTQKTLTSPVLNTGISGTAVKDEDNMASDSNTHLATQQSIKAYADSLVGAPEAHKDSHDPENGSDALDTAAAAEISAVVAAGTGASHSLARADHIHAINHAITDNHIATIDGTTNQPVNSDYAKFTANGLEGKALAEVKTDLGIDYQTIYIDAGAMLSCTTNGAETGTEEYAADKSEMDYFGFDTATDERVQFKLTMPENWDRGTIKALFFWSDSGGATASGTVAWAIKAVALSNDDPLGTTAFGTAVVATADTLLASDDMHITAVTGAITVGGSPAINEALAFEIYRDVSADTLDEDARLFGVEVQFKVTNVVVAW